MSLPEFALRKKSIVIAATLLLMVWGIIGMFQNSRREDPGFTIRTCAISTGWPGATAEDIENLVSDPIEEVVEVLDGVDLVRSRSTSGRSMVFVDLIDQLAPEKIDDMWDKVKQKVDTVALPEGCGRPIINRDFGDTASFLIGVYQDPDASRGVQYTPRELDLISIQLKDQLLLLPSVARVDRVGVADEAIYLETDLGAWSQLDLTTAEIQQFLQERNIVSPGGTIDTDVLRLGVKPSGDLDAVDEIDRIITGYGATGTPIYLADLGITTSRRYVEPLPRRARYSAPELEEPCPCIVLSIMMRDGKNVVQMGEEIVGILRAAGPIGENGYSKVYGADFLPKDIRLSVLSNVPAIVSHAIEGVFVNLGQSVALVVGVAMLLIGLRIALVMAAAIPLVMVSTLGLMTLWDVELETMSIASLIIALGMLVDNAIEVCDNAHNHLAQGMSKFQACVQGVNQIAFPILIATLTSVFAFVPMLTIPGSMGEYVRSIPIVVSIALSVSYVLAVTTTTMMAYLALRPGHSLSPIAWLAQTVGKILRRKSAPGESGGFAAICMTTIRLRLLTIAMAIALFVGCMWLLAAGKVGTAFFPAALRNQFTIKIALPEGSPVEATNRTVALVERHLLAQGGDDYYNSVAYVGEGGPRWYLSLQPEDPASNVGFIQVNCSDALVVDDFMARLGKSFSLGSEEHGLPPVTGAALSYAKLQKGPPLEYPVSFRLYGKDIPLMRDFARRMKEALSEIEGTWDVNDDWGNLSYQLDVDVDEDAANLAGVTNASLARTLNAYFSGHLLTTFREGDHNVPVYLRLPPDQRGSLDRLESIYVEGKAGKVPLASIATAEPTWKLGKISRRGQTRCMTIRSRVREGLLSNDVTKAALPKMKEIEASMPPGYRVEVAGEQAESSESQGYMANAFLISFLLIVMCLMVQFNSFGKVFITILTLPLAWAGGIFGLFLTGNPLGFMPMLGLISLGGIVINVAIVLIDFIEHEIRDKLKVGEDLAAEGERAYGGLTREGFRKAVVAGTKMRILPISLTTLTTVGGLLPLALGGDPFWEAMAWLMIFGLLVSAIMALFVIPAIYTLAVERLGMRAVVVPGTEES